MATLLPTMAIPLLPMATPSQHMLHTQNLPMWPTQNPHMWPTPHQPMATLSLPMDTQHPPTDTLNQLTLPTQSHLMAALSQSQLIATLSQSHLMATLSQSLPMVLLSLAMDLLSLISQRNLFC